MGTEKQDSLMCGERKGRSKYMDKNKDEWPCGPTEKKTIEQLLWSSVDFLVQVLGFRKPG